MAVLLIRQLKYNVSRELITRAGVKSLSLSLSLSLFLSLSLLLFSAPYLSPTLSTLSFFLSPSLSLSFSLSLSLSLSLYFACAVFSTTGAAGVIVGLAVPSHRDLIRVRDQSLESHLSVRSLHRPPPTNTNTHNHTHTHTHTHTHSHTMRCSSWEPHLPHHLSLPV